jgi:hypothetical protein
MDWRGGADMTLDELLLALFQAATEHLKLPEGYGWASFAGLILVTAFGLLLLVRGAKWAPAFGALTFLGLGVFVGAFLARAIGTPMWITSGLTGVVGCVLGLVLFRFWQALLLGMCFVIAGLSVYSVRSLHVEMENWMSLPPGADITLPAAGSVVGEHQLTATQKLSSLWTHLSENVPHFTLTFWALVVSTGLAGLVFGLLLPRISRALWAASLGTLFFGIGVTILLRELAPSALDWLGTHHALSWSIVAALWLLSLAHNLVSCRRRKPAADKSEADIRAKGKPATA